MKNLLLKRSIALFVCLTLIISLCNGNIVKANTVNDNSLIGSATIFNEDIVNDPEVALIDSIAKEYYNYFKDNNIEEEIYTIATDISSGKEISVLPNVTTNSISPFSSVFSDGVLDYSYYVKEVTGQTFTLSQIGIQLAALGTKLNLGAALPFLEFLALLAGGIILTLTIAILYSAIAVGVNDLILTWYQYSSVNLTAAKQNTMAIVAQQKNGAKYWRAYLANYGGLGGIAISDPITYSQASELVKLDMSTVNVFAFNYSDAAYLATYAYGFGFTNPEAHRDNGKILNMQHVHAYITQGKIHGKCHIFFAVPVVA